MGGGGRYHEENQWIVFKKDENGFESAQDISGATGESYTIEKVTEANQYEHSIEMMMGSKVPFDPIIII